VVRIKMAKPTRTKGELSIWLIFYSPIDVLISQFSQYIPFLPPFRISQLKFEFLTVFRLAFRSLERFNSLKGYGFIVPSDGSPDIFVHQSEIKADGFRSLADGEAVEYEPFTESSGKTKATKVTGPNGAQVQGAPFRPQQPREW